VNVSHPFILRPIATTLLIVGVVLLGLLGYRLLPVAALPSVDFPTIQVVTSYPGAAPEIMASSITTPLEHQLGTISGLTSMSSTSSFGNSQITLQFDLSRDIDSAAQDVQSQINAAQGIIPSTKLPNPPTYSKVNPADTPIMILALTSDQLPLRTVNDYTDTVVAQKLSQVEGVGVVTIEGGQKEAVRIQLNPTQIANLGLALDDARTAISSATVDLAKGSIDGARQSFQIGADDQLFDANGYRNQILAYRNGAPIRLKDIATVVDGVENDKLAGWYNGKPAVILDIQRQPGANIIETVAAIRKLMPKLTAALPPSIKIDVLTDRTETIRASVADVQFTLVLTIALVVMVIFLFLRKFWATVIPSVTLPVSLIATFGIMSLCGFSLDNLSLMALTIASGFVVDDAIVMIENIVRYIEAGETPLDAALKGAKQIGFTIISLTVSLIAVFIPLLLMGGVIGRLFREFAITLSAAVVISAIVSLTLTPMMCAQLLKPEDPDHKPGALFRWSERFFDWMRDGYEAGLRWVLRHQTLTLVFTVVTIGITVLLYIEVPKGFLPQQDTGLIVGVTDAAQDISFNGMAQRQQAIAAEVMKDPDVTAVDSFVGTGTVNTTPNSGRLYINLKPRDQRTANSDEIIERLKARVAGVHGITLYMQSAQDIQIDNRLSRTQYQYTLQDANVAELGQWVPKLVAELKQQPELADVATDQQNAGLQALVKIDRDAAARLGVSMQAIDDTLYDAFGQRQIATIYTQLNQYHVILGVDPAFQKDKNGLDKIYVQATNGSVSNGTQLSNGVVASTTPTSNGSQTTSNTATTTTLNSGKGTEVPLSAVATIVTQLAPLVVTHQGLFPATTLSFNVPEGTSLGAALAAIQRAEDAIGLPETIATGFAGSAAEFRNSLDSELGLILAAIVTVYIVLGVLYESYIHPITILSTLPSAGIGALLSLILTGQDLSVISLIGIILLIGIVKKNAIMMIDFAIDAERQGGMSAEQSIYQACLLRFRPIMMTTMAALLGALPLAIGTGTGSELRRPLGIAIVGGLVLSQFLTLYTTPVIYLFFERLRHAVGHRLRPRTVEALPHPAPFNARRDPDAAE
jgi:hydrophobe/amphiphile efflux-1 (HAE1) family protein